MTRFLNKTLLTRTGICIAFIALLGTVIQTQKLDMPHSAERSEKTELTQQHPETQASPTPLEQIRDPYTVSDEEKTAPENVPIPEQKSVTFHEGDASTQKMPLQPTDNQPTLIEPPTPSRTSLRSADVTANDSTMSTQVKSTTGIDTELKRFQNSDFYRTIIDNNLFRALGTERAQPTPRYRLICTTTPTDEDVGGEALIEDITGGNAVLRVRLGTIIGNATVVDIQPKQVVLDEKGKQTTLHLQEHLWLSPK